MSRRKGSHGPRDATGDQEPIRHKGGLDGYERAFVKPKVFSERIYLVIGGRGSVAGPSRSLLFD